MCEIQFRTEKLKEIWSQLTHDENEAEAEAEAEAEWHFCQSAKMELIECEKELARISG
jgi:hypothetical protein